MPVKWSLACAAALFFIRGACADEAQSLIDCDFSVRDEGEKLLAAPAPAGDAALPLKSPTNIIANPPSTITAGTTEEGGQAPPYVLIENGPHPSAPDNASGTFLQWMLKDLGLTAGTYEISAKITQLEPLQGGRFKVVMIDQQGAPYPTINAGMPPFGIYFRNDTIVAPGSDPNVGDGGILKPAVVGQAYDVKIVINMDAKTWTVSWNELEEREPFAFPSKMEEQGGTPQIGWLEFASDGGLGDKAGSKFAISQVRMKKLPPAQQAGAAAK